MAQTDRLAGLVGNVAIKAPCDVATTANITLNGEQTIDGVVTSASRVLVKNQTNPINNGIYLSDSGAWSRTADFDGVRDVAQGTLVLVNGGTAGAGFWYVSTTGNPTPGTDAIAFGQSSAVLALISAFMQSFLQQTTAAGARTAIGAGDATQAGVQGQTYQAFTTAGTATAFTLTPTPATTGNVAGQRFRITFNNAAGATPTLSVSGQTAKNIKYKDTSGTKQAVTSSQIPSGWTSDVEYDGTDWMVLNVPPITITRAALAGLGMSTAGASTTMTIAAGQAADSTNAVYITLASAMSKTTSAWAAGTGNGGLDTGAIANSTTYHFYVISKTDGTTEVVFSTNASTPSLPSGYTYFRRIGSMRTNGSAQWTSFIQDGDYFRLLASVQDIANTNFGTSAVTGTLTSIPTGINVQAMFNGVLTDTTPLAAQVQFSDLAANDEAPSGSAAPGFMLRAISGTVSGGQPFQIRTNTSAQIRYRSNASDAGVTLRINTLGWIDRRGRDA